MKRFNPEPNTTFEIDSETIGIETFYKGERFVCLVDKEDYPRVQNFKWNLTGVGKNNSTRYARASLWNNGPTVGMTIFIHKLILSFPEGMQVDHINRNGLDNRKKNLRLARQLDNARNKTYKKRAKSGFVGVRESKSALNPWRASIYHEGKLRDIGYFKTKEEAAKAYDVAAIEIRGAFAVLNLPHDFSSKCG